MTNTIGTLNKDNFGVNLRKVRLERGFTIEEFAFLIDKSPRLIYDYEDGFKYPRLETIIDIALSLDVSVDSLLRK